MPSLRHVLLHQPSTIPHEPKHEPKEARKISDEFAALLSYLNPPNQEYGLLADGAAHLLARLPNQPSAERALAAYFQLFARGYAIWQSSYHYNVVHEYFYGAYVQAIELGATSIPDGLAEMLLHFTEAMIAYTHCENAVISNDAKHLRQSANKAYASASKALDLLHRVDLPQIGERGFAALETYLNMNLALFHGLDLCAEIYVHDGQSIDMDTWLNETNQSLAVLDSCSRELFSELRAHITFAKRYLEYRSRITSKLSVTQADLVLRAIAYVSEDTVRPFFNHVLASSQGDREMVDRLTQETKLPILAVRRSVLQDLFETGLGEKYLEQVVIDFDCSEQALSFAVCDGPQERQYAFTSMQIRIARFGSISVEFVLPVSVASVSHLRVLESLISPHSGRVEYHWRTGPSDAHYSSPDYVEACLGLQENKAAPLHVRGTASPTVMDSTSDESNVQEYRSPFLGLSRCLLEDMPEPADLTWEAISNAKGKRLRSAREELHKRIQSMGNIGQREAVTYGYLVDIAKEIFERIGAFLYLMSNGRLEQDQIQLSDKLADATRLDAAVIDFDPNTGWQAIIACNELALTSTDERRVGDNELDATMIQEHPDFKGLIIQNREARASLDDWRHVEMPPYRNLATIRSHETDLMVVGENRVILYLPDDPQYLIAQYIASAAIVGDIRSIVLAFNQSTKAQTAELEEWLQNLRVQPKMGLAASQRMLLQMRQQIEVLRTDADQLLDLIRSYTISKYQDHSDLLRAMVLDSGVDRFAVSLQRNMETLNHFHAYLTELIQRKIDVGNQANQAMIAWLLFVLSCLGALAAIDPVASFLASMFGTAYNSLFKVGLYVAVGLFVFMGGTFAWIRSRNQ